MTVIAGPGAEALNVSRETYERLQGFAELLIKWNPKINLISRASLPDLWTRHIVDSMQVFDVAPNAQHWVDIGTGGGFPGIVAAILAAETSPDTKFTLIESDQRKSAFLRNAVRLCNLNATILAERIESVAPQGADVISARALSDLTTLLGYGERHASADCTMIFPKGKSWGKEVDDARTAWNFELETARSKTEPEAVLLIIKGVSRD